MCLPLLTKTLKYIALCARGKSLAQPEGQRGPHARSTESECLQKGRRQLRAMRLACGRRGWPDTSGCIWLRPPIIVIPPMAAARPYFRISPLIGACRCACAVAVRVPIFLSPVRSRCECIVEQDPALRGRRGLGRTADCTMSQIRGPTV